MARALGFVSVAGLMLAMSNQCGSGTAPEPVVRPAPALEEAPAAESEPPSAPIPAGPSLPPLEPTSSLVPSDAGLPRKELPEATCTKLATAADRELRELEQPCESADDCELVDSACPFGCWLVLSRHAERQAAERALDRYFDGCRVCKDKCSQTPGQLACVVGRCSAALD